MNSNIRSIPFGLDCGIKMSETLRRSARLATQKTAGTAQKLSEDLKYLKGQGLVIKSGAFYRIGVASENVKASAHSFLVSLLQEAGSELKYQAEKELNLEAKDIINLINLKPEGKYFKITKKQLYDINSLFDQSSEEEPEHVEVKKRRTSTKPVVGKKTKSKKPTAVTSYKKGLGNPKVKVIPYTDYLLDPSPDPKFGISIRVNSLNFHRAVATNNKKLLASLLHSSYKIGQVMQSWGPEHSLCCLERAILQNNEYFVTKIIQEINTPKIKKGYQPPSSIAYISTGSVCVEAYGVRTRKVQMSRGGREGNNAFYFETAYTDTTQCLHTADFVKNILRKGVSSGMLTTLISLEPHFENTLGMHIGESVRSGNLDLALFLTSHFNKKGGYGLNFLHEEVLKKGNLTAFKKTSITKKPIENYLFAPLHAACINPDPRHLLSLIAACDDLGYQDSEGRRVVHYAAACTSAGPLKALLDHGCNPSETDKFKVTPLMLAAMYNRVDTAKLLLEKGVPVHVKAKDGRAAIHFAADNGSLQVLEVLLDNGANIDQPGTDRKTPLMFAAIRGHFECLRELIDRGAKDTKKDKCRRSALIWAVKNGHAREVSLLLSHGSPFDEPDSSKNYALHYAAAYGWIECIQLLLQAGAEVNVSNDWKLQPLLIGMLKGQVGCVKLLLEQPGVDVNGKDETGRTLVSQSIELLSEESLGQLRYLLEEKKADPNITDVQGYTALHHLCSKGRPLCQNSTWTSEQRKEWECMACEWQVRAAEVLLEFGCGIDARTNEGLTPIMYAMKTKNTRLVETLIGRGADMQSTSPNGGGVFHYLISFDCEIMDICRMLLQRKEITECALNIIDEEGFSPFLRYVEFFAANFEGQKAVIYEEEKKKMEADLLLQRILAQSAQSIPLNTSNFPSFPNLPPASGSSPSQGLLFNNAPSPSIPLSFGVPQQSSLFGAPQNAPFGAAAMFKPSSPFGGITASNTSSLFGNTPTPAPTSGKGFFMNATPAMQQPTGINSYLAANMSLQIDYTQLEVRKQERLRVVVEDCIDMLKLMVEKGADYAAVVQKLKKYRENPELIYAEELSNVPTQDYMGNLIRPEVYVLDIDGTKLYKEYGPKGLQNSLHIIAASNEARVISFLLSLGIEVNARDFLGNTPLSLFTSSNNIASNLLIDAKADPNIANIEGDTPVSLAVGLQSIAQIDWLITAGALLNVLNKEGTSPLIKAVEKKNIAIVRKLLEAGADPNFRDIKKRTSLHIAMNVSEATADASFDMESLLLLYKADINALDCRNRTPLHYCFIKIGKSRDMQQIDPIEAVSSACSLRDIQVNIQDSWKKTPLHYAAQRGALTSSMFLLSKGAELDLEDEDGNTALALSIREGHANYGVMLVQKGANVMNNVKVPRPKDPALQQKKNSKKNASAAQYNPFGGGIFGRNNYNNPFGYQQAPASVLSEGTYSMFKAAIIQGWQGLAYLLLFNGYPYMLAMQDAMTQNKFQLVKTLLAKVSDNSVLQQVNEYGQNLFHTLAIYGANAEFQITQVICEQLIERKVNLHEIDKYGRSPLHYAARSNYLFFTQILLTHGVRHDLIDSDGYCPLAYSIAGPKILTCLPSLQIYHLFGVNFAIRFNERGVVLTPLLHSIKEKAPATIIKYLLDCGCSLQETDSKGRNAFMYAISNNDTELVKALLTEGTLDMSQKDTEKRTALHHVVQPLPYGSFENTTILELLLRQSQDPHAQDAYGVTAYQLAYLQRSGRMLEVFRSLNILEATPHIMRRLSGYLGEEDEFDYIGDAEEYIRTQTDTRKVSDIKRKPDESGDFPVYYEVLEDYDLIMTKVDLSYGPYSAYVFYRMQVLVDTNRDVYVLYTRWGRIGEVGASQRTPFGNRDEAVDEFRKIFKAKSGNEWGSTFEKRKGKYLMMKLDLKQVKCKDFISEFNTEGVPEAEIGPDVEGIVKEFSSQTIYRTIFRSFDININVINFSNLSKDTIHNAEQIMLEISKRSKAMELEADTSKKIEIIEEIQELSSRYYELIPTVHQTNSAVPPIIHPNTIKLNLDKLSLMKNIELASKVILGALHQQYNINPYDYVYRCLDTNIMKLPNNDEEAALIFKYLEAGGGNRMYASVFKLERKGETERIAKYQHVRQRKLLWHGTSSANIVGILMQGLKIAPPEVPNMGYMFGKGVYFADYFGKSEGYCTAESGSATGYFLLLCEVVLGESLVKSQAEYIEALPEEYLSTLGYGQSGPDPANSVYTPYGVQVPVGNMIRQEQFGCSFSHLSYNEYIVYDTAQIRIRYLVHVKR